MEGANETGRVAVAGLLEAAGSKADAAADVQALRPAGVRGGEGLDRELYSRAGRTRSTSGVTGRREHADAVVVGARCAGSAAATALARAGRRVVALERARFPADTLSTHLLFLGGVVELERLGALERVLGAGRAAAREARGLGGYEIRAGYTRSRASTTRSACAVPASTRRSPRRPRGRRRDPRGCRVRGCVCEDGRMAGVRYRDTDGDEREIRAPLVVGADGRRSLVARDGRSRGPAPAQRERPRVLLRLLARRPARVARRRRAVAAAASS